MTHKPDVASNRLTFWQRLAYTFYNPMVNVDMHWAYLGQCDFEEPRNLCISSISFEADDTQEFEKAEELIERVNETHNMHQLIEVIEKYIINGDEVTNG